MSKKLLAVLLGAALSLSTVYSVAADQTLADFHVEMGGCENCHEDGKTVSKDGIFEMEQCQACHGGMDEMSEVHQSHQGMMECSDCHQTHEMTLDQKPTCDACHDDGRVAK